MLTDPAVGRRTGESARLGGVVDGEIGNDRSRDSVAARSLHWKRKVERGVPVSGGHREGDKKRERRTSCESSRGESDVSSRRPSSDAGDRKPKGHVSTSERVGVDLSSVVSISNAISP